jgi:hypothetical protein
MRGFREFYALDPLRPVDWRFQMAADRVARKAAFPRARWDFVTTLTALSLQRRAAAAPSDRRHRLGKPRDLDVALEIHLDRDRSLRFALEARIMADERPTRIAERLGVSALAVKLYEAVAFDVRERLDRGDFVTTRVVGTGSERPYNWRDSGWKFLGFFGGAAALDSVIGQERGAGIEQVEFAERQSARIALLHRLRRLIEGGADLNPRLLRDLIQFVGERTAEELPAYAEMMDALIQSIPPEILLRGDNTQLPGGHPSAAELRADELLFLSLGREVPGLAELENLRIPKPGEESDDAETGR